MTEIIPGIYRLKIPLPDKNVLGGYVNVYLIEGDNGYLLVDTGWDTDEAFDSLESQMVGLGINVEYLSQIIATHIHPDHYGLAGKLKQFSGASVAVHSLEKSLIDSRYVHMDELLRQLELWLHANGVPDSILPQLQTVSASMVKFVTPAMPDITLQGDEMLTVGQFNLRVIPSAGHSPGHICLYEPDRRILFSGDHILPTVTPNIGLHPQSSENPLGDYVNSLSSFKALDVDLVLPGHEEPFQNLPARIEELKQHHRQRSAEILETIKSEPETAYQIANEIIWVPEQGGVRWSELGPLDKRLAVLETTAHLELMRFAGKVNKLKKDGITYFQSL